MSTPPLDNAVLVRLSSSVPKPNSSCMRCTASSNGIPNDSLSSFCRRLLCTSKKVVRYCCTPFGTVRLMFSHNPDTAPFVNDASTAPGEDFSDASTCIR